MMNNVKIIPKIVLRTQTLTYMYYLCSDLDSDTEDSVSDAEDSVLDSNAKDSVLVLDLERVDSTTSLVIT